MAEKMPTVRMPEAEMPERIIVIGGTPYIRADLVDDAVKALEAQIRSHAMLCLAAGLTDQDHALGTSQARAALTRIKGDGK